MKRGTAMTLVATLFSGVQLASLEAQDAANGTLLLSGDSKLWVTGSSTVRDYKCVATIIDAKISTTPEGNDVPLDRLVTGATVSVEVNALDCANGTMNGHMRKALKQAEAPTISFTLDSYEIKGDTATLVGKLTMAGSENAVTFTSAITEEGDQIRLIAAKPINMKEWGVKPPSLLLGSMKVKEMVTINFDVTFKR